jgi:hypothetical protein
VAWVAKGAQSHVACVGQTRLQTLCVRAMVRPNSRAVLDPAAERTQPGMEVAASTRLSNHPVRARHQLVRAQAKGPQAHTDGGPVWEPDVAKVIELSGWPEDVFMDPAKQVREFTLSLK